MYDFVNFILSKSYKYNPRTLDISTLKNAHELCLLDVKYHYDLPSEVITGKIQSNCNELPIFLYRLGNLIFSKEQDHPLLANIHWALREICGCELYFSTHIDEGFYITHGLGTVIGSRNSIGKGFRIYQGCTIGHKIDAGKGCVIGNDVTMYSNSQILGELTIGDNAVIGSNSLVLNNVPANSVAKGSPAKFNQIKNT